MAITLKDIAKKVGVNVSTVSRALNNKGYISDDLKKRIYEAMDELNYQPNEVARSLSRKRSNVIGLILPTISHPFSSELSEYIENYAYQYKYKVLLCTSQNDKEKELMHLNYLKANRVDGIIMGSQTVDIEEFSKVGLPLVTLGRAIDPSIPFVTSDNYEGGRLATELLISKGCRRIAMVSDSLDLQMLTNNRYKAFIDVTRDHGVWHTVLQTDINGFHYKDHLDIVKDLFQTHPNIDGIFVTSDVIAAILIKICEELGISVPDDVKIVGYDGVLLSSLTSPTLTTVAQPIREIGKVALDNLIAQINGEQVKKENTLPVKLVIGEST